MIKILTIIGARPQIIKAAAISRAIRNSFQNIINEVIVHTGQHYDNNMSQVFIDELGIPKPDYNLNVGSDSQGRQTANMITGIEEILLKEQPSYIVIYGDTNSTLAGSVAASKLHVPIIHIEAGLRSFNKRMPEEINRILSDHCSTLLFSPSASGYQNLLKEGFKADTKPPYSNNNPYICHCGDIMYDNSLYFAAKAETSQTILNRFALEKNNFILSTIHRDNNTDDPVRLNAIFKTLNYLTKEFNIKLILPLHPRTSKLLKTNLNENILKDILENKNFIIIEAVSFLDMILLEKSCKMIITDSGGVQKEAYFFKKPCIILRSETEWVEIVESGATVIGDCDEKKIIDAYRYFEKGNYSGFPEIFGDGKAAEFICSFIIQNS